DYVDQFLFESQVGYCDNFSTAMVVLLRSLEIPARWAKGFSPGSPATENGITTYTVRNLNAHSWVEVYFDGYGWVPFEPTP
ncbi:transglutaminase domain-containing protein, partial [Enterococcus faecalis]|nr:transglutaminase domain-containing protein [Enterococcus faecalis]